MKQRMHKRQPAIYEPQHIDLAMFPEDPNDPMLRPVRTRGLGTMSYKEWMAILGAIRNGNPAWRDAGVGAA